MRLLIYLLAMMTGFSAAEVARPLAANPATVAQAAVVAASVALAQQETTPEALRTVPVLPVLAMPRVHVSLAFAVSSPVLRHDVIRA